MELKPTEEAFKSAESLKKAITTEEFEAVLKIVETQYERVSSFVKHRKEIVDKCKEKMREAKESMYLTNPEAFSSAVKSSKALLFSTDKEAYNDMKIQMDNINIITEFLNRFREPSKYLQKVDISFINRLKTK